MLKSDTDACLSLSWVRKLRLQSKITGENIDNIFDIAEGKNSQRLDTQEEMRQATKKTPFCKSVFSNSLVMLKIFETLWKEK